MKKIVVAFCLIALCMCIWASSCNRPKRSAVEEVRTLTAVHIGGLKSYVTQSLLAATQRRAPLDSLRQHFLQTRLLYKRFEWAAEYFMTHTTRWVNGPPVPEIEVEENKLTEPEGLQVMEALLYPTPDSVDYAALERQARLLMAHCTRYQTYWNDLPMDSSQIFDAARLELFRIVTLGISSFDASLAKSSVAEAAVSVQSVEEVVNVFDEPGTQRSLFAKAKACLFANQDFDSFDRMAFIKGYSEPLTKGLTALQKSLGVPFVNDLRLLRPDAASLFEQGAFSANAYTQDSAYWTSPEKVALGKRLFYDPVLSANNSRNCATCHRPEKAFTDGLAVSAALGNGLVRRNAPTLLNAALQPAQFYDMRTTNLENQSRDVIHNKAEMHGNLSDALKEIASNPDYVLLLQKAFPKAALFTEQHLQNALASYVRSLALLNSRFDKYMRNEGNALLTEEEKGGFNLFTGKAKCATCHFLPLFNGTVPPHFLEMESEVIGVPDGKNAQTVDADSGRYALYKLPPLLHAFKTATVRNAALTSPYMHNGAFGTLEEVIDFYDRGGGAGLGIRVPNQTLPPERLNLTPDEKRKLIAFLHTLNDEERSFGQK